MTLRAKNSRRDPARDLFVAETAALEAQDVEKQRARKQCDDHRFRKLLLTVRAIARQTLRDSTDLAAFETAFDGRIEALTNVHDELVRNDGRFVDLRRLIHGNLAGIGPEQQCRVHLQGPDIQLDPDAALSLALPLHELVTHAGRHGALSQPSGSVSVEWSSTEGALSLSWIEGGAKADPAEHDRFATLLLTRSLEYELDAEASLIRAAEGLQFSVRAPRAVI